MSGEAVAAVALVGWPKVNPAGLPWHQLLDVPMGGPVLLALVAWLWLLWRSR